MPDTPRPEHFSSFKDWLEAARRAHGLKKAAIAEIAKKSPQAASKWFKGGDIEPEPLKRISDWSGASYAELRMLLDGQPLTPKRRNGAATATSHVVHRLTKKLEQLAADDTSITAVEALVDSLISSHTKGRRRAPRE